MILAITGALGCGKSRTTESFARQGFATCDADKLCHGLYDTIRDEIAANWGDWVFGADGGVDRRKLAEKVFSCEKELAKLTGLLYPVLTAELQKMIDRWRREKRNAAVEVPLLFESRMDGFFDATVAVYTAENIRRERLKKRGLSQEDIDRRDARQLPGEQKMERADYALINNHSETLLDEQVKFLINRLCRQEI